MALTECVHPDGAIRPGRKCFLLMYVQHYTRKLGWKLKRLIRNDHWLYSEMHVQVLSQGVLLDSSPGWP